MEGAPMKVTVTVSDDQVMHAEAVAERLRRAGMHVDDVLGSIGIITGSVPGGRRASIERVAGVAAIEEDHAFGLPPPDAEIQ